MSELQFVFVHGLSGWGSYDDNYRKMPYWGMRGGDLMVYLRSQGYACYAASVAPAGSAWDRACELYAQLAGTRTDYGKAHSTAFRHERFGRDRRDYASYDMHIDNAMAMNARIPTLADTYYYSVPCCATRRRADGTCMPVREMEPLFVMRSTQIGAYAGTTAGGERIDETWRDNDGLVNTVSAAVPSGAPSVPKDRDGIRPGIWNVFPVLRADHMYLQGGLMHRHDIRAFYLELLEMIAGTEKNPPPEFF